MCLQFLVPALENGTLAELRVRTLVYRHIFAVGGVSPKLLAVRVLEDDDWRGLDGEIHWHLRVTMFIVLATTREDEHARLAHSIDPALSGIDIIVQGHETHFDVVEF